MTTTPYENNRVKSQILDEESTLATSLDRKDSSIKEGKENGVGRREVDVRSVSDSDSTIKERGLSWISTASLLLTEYVVLAILAFPSSFAVLGMAGGVICTLIVGLATFWTSHVLWRFCLQYPGIQNIADAAQQVGGKRIYWYAAFLGLAANNLAIQALHVNAGATAIQTIRGGTECTLIWAIVITVIMFLGSLIRELKHLSALGLLASSTMFICFLIVVIGHGVQGTPNGYTATLGFPTITTWSPPGTTFVQTVNAILNITYTWVGQALIPTFIGDMERPQDFPKALYLSMIAEFALFTTCGAVVYYYAGTQYTTAPAYGSLIERLGKVAAGFTLPTIVIVGIMYSLVTSRAIYFQIYTPDSIHRRFHTVQGWSVWGSIVFGGWAIAFVIGEAIPFFNDLLSLISSLFDSWFGFVLWGLCWYSLNKGRTTQGWVNKVENGLAAIMIVAGLFFFFAGTYTSVQSIIDSYRLGAVKQPFRCTNTGFDFSR